MRCPNCGNQKLAYDVSRSQYQKHSSHGKTFTETKAPEPRTDFNATCKKCKWHGIIEP